MNKDKAIAAVYKILPMYEEVVETQSEMVYRAYLAYLSNRVDMGLLLALMLTMTKFVARCST